jgi:tetratricopeptide (TPR) repeat protein
VSHLSEEEIGRFLDARLDTADQQRVVRHLMAGCGTCSRRLVEQAPGSLLDQAAEARPGRAERRSARTRAAAAALRREDRVRMSEARLARSLELLRASPQGYDGLSSRQVQALYGPPLVEALLQCGFELRYTHSKGMRWLAYNAVKAAEELRADEHAPALVLDLQARAWAALANAYKVNEEYGEAEAAFARARDLLRRGSGDPHLLAGIALLEASLMSSQRRLRAARELLDGAHRLYLKLGDRHLAGQALLSKGLTAEHDGTYPEGVALFRRGFAFLDPERDPQLVAIGQQGMITALVGAGEYHEAGRLLLRSDLRQRLTYLPNVRWVEARLLAGLGRLEKAERAFGTVREEFLERGRSISAALVGLDLLPILLRQGRLGQARQTAREIYGTLRDLGIHRDAAKVQPYLQ